MAIVLTPISDHHLRLASQLGVSDVVIRFPGLEYSDLADLKTRIESFGLRVPVMEGYLPIEDIKLGGGRRDVEIEQMKTLIRNMGRAGIGLLCYNFIAGGDWARTSVNEKGRGGALVTGFDLSALPQDSSSGKALPSADDLWENLDTFLERILPVAEECGVTLVMHPDDPPIPNFQGFPRIMNSLEGFERLVRLRSSPANGICFCQGPSPKWEWISPPPSGVWDLTSSTSISGTSEGPPARFVETFHDEGQTDMVEAMRAYRDIHFEGPMRPDHVPQLAGEEEGEAGYTMLGRLFAVGYMRGLMAVRRGNAA